MRTALMLARWRFHMMRENFMVNFTYRLPHWVKYWCAIHIAAEATMGEYGNTDVTTLTVPEMLQRAGK